MSITRRTAFVALAVVGVVLVVAMVATLNGRGGHSGASVDAKALGSVGPTPGPDSDGHIRAQRAYLDELEAHNPGGRAAAVVSLARFMRAHDVESLIAGMRITQAFVKFPGSQIELFSVPTSLTDAMSTRATQVAADLRAEIAGLSKTGSSLVAQRQKDLQGTTADCECVYAVVVQNTTVGALHALEGHTEIRLVDVPKPLVDDLAGWNTTPISPPGPAA